MQAARSMSDVVNSKDLCMAPPLTADGDENLPVSHVNTFPQIAYPGRGGTVQESINGVQTVGGFRVERSIEGFEQAAAVAA